MKPVFWNNEADKVETLEDIRSSFDLFAEEYESFPDYLSACMWYNNGALTYLCKHVEKLRSDLNRFEEFYDDDERQALRKEIRDLEKIYLET